MRGLRSAAAVEPEIPDLRAQQNEDRSIGQQGAPGRCSSHTISHVIAACSMREPSDAVDGEEGSSGSNKGEDERPGLAMLAQMKHGDHH